MPDVVACLWNIQNYGQDSAKYDGAGAPHSNAARNAFIAAFCADQDIDVLLIQEVLEGSAQTALTDLVTQLNAALLPAQQDWVYSWCGSALRGTVGAEATVVGDIKYRTGARTEGYAVVWRSNQLARFTMIEARHPIASGAGPVLVASPLNMSQTGLKTGMSAHALGRETFGSVGGYTAAGLYPYSRNPLGAYVMQAAWPQLLFPSTSITDGYQLKWTGVRRPVYVVLKLATAPAVTLCPISAYHAPSHQAQSRWGAYMAGMSRELYVINQIDAADAPTAGLVNVTMGVFGGDFNLSVNALDWPGDYRYFVDPYHQDTSGGANCTPAPAPGLVDTARRTSVQIVEGAGHNLPIVMPNTSDYFRYKIDLAFFPAGSGIVGVRVNLLDDVIANVGNVYTAAIQAAGAVMTTTAAAVALAAPGTQRLAVTGPEQKHTKRKRSATVVYWSPIICGAWGGTFTVWATSLAEFNAGAINDARRAGEYVHIFVSDHLPLVMTIPI